jgi:DHA1 family bicyclomycin/chloramphenicol resistance-like MFS transporter
LLSEVAGWRSLFGVLAVAGMAGAMIALRALPETRPRSTERTGPSLAAGFGQLITEPAFLRPVLGIVGGSSALYMYLGTAPFLLAAEHGLRPREVGLCLMLTASASIAGTFLVAPVERRGDALCTGSLLNFGAAAALLLLALTGHHSLVGFLLTTTLLGLGAGMSGPAAISRVIAAKRGLEGTAASLSGAAQMLIAALAAALLGRLAPVTPIELSGALVIATGIAAFANWQRPARM